MSFPYIKKSLKTYIHLKTKKRIHEVGRRVKNSVRIFNRMDESG